MDKAEGIAHDPIARTKTWPSPFTAQNPTLTARIETPAQQQGCGKPLASLWRLK
jgi:hypothetical protein